MFIWIFSEKVYFLDIKEDEGKNTEKRLQSQYGEDKVKFLKCDVKNSKDLEGNIKI